MGRSLLDREQDSFRQVISCCRPSNHRLFLVHFGAEAGQVHCAAFCLCSSSTKQREVLDGALEELDIGGARLSGIVPGKAEHLVGHVDAVGEPGLADSTGRQQDVDPRRQSPVKHLLTLSKFRHGNGATAGVVDLQDSVTRWISPSREGAKSDLESERNVLILKWVPHDL
jgi:hypothetical protein